MALSMSILIATSPADAGCWRADEVRAAKAQLIAATIARCSGQTMPSKFDAVISEAGLVLKARKAQPETLSCDAIDLAAGKGDVSLATLAAHADARGVTPELDAPVCQVRLAVLTH